jgi:hypothetical protein
LLPADTKTWTQARQRNKRAKLLLKISAYAYLAAKTFIKLQLLQTMQTYSNIDTLLRA